jgi:hypothetical protein
MRGRDQICIRAYSPEHYLFGSINGHAGLGTGYGMLIFQKGGWIIKSAAFILGKDSMAEAGYGVNKADIPGRCRNGGALQEKEIAGVLWLWQR